jgi:lipopolysaccharide/colanic/teichoic acid biosynthesis glycosyltransferase
VVIPYGIDVETEPADVVRRRAAEIRGGHAMPIVLFVGRLVSYKGVEVLLDAMRGVPAVLLIVGGGPLRGSLEARARELGVDEQVRFHGEVSGAELEALYLACDMFVLPSVTRQEAFGVVQIEAMARGKPVISTSVGTGVSWVNQHLETGVIVAPGDRGALHDAIQQLISDAALRAATGRRAAERARSMFSRARMIESAVDVFHDVLTADVEFPPSTFGKRALDIALSGAGLIASAPLWFVLAALIKLEDGGPVFFSQERVGLGGRRFRALKFRSMVANAEDAVGAIQARQDDPRITRIGRLMRATAMDELPQLWNIFRGDMSFVGPRALRPGEIEVNGGGTSERIEDVPGFEARCAVRPGLTGVAQIYAPRDVVRRQKFRYDRVYIRRRSLWLDIRLIVLSFWITVRGSWEVRGRKF